MRYIIILLILISFNASARIMEFESTSNETKQDFIIRVGLFLKGWTTDNGVEACGRIAVKDGAYSVILQTSGIQIWCDSNLIYNGWTDTGETIHSHPDTPKNGVLRLTAKTRQAIGISDAFRKIKRHAFSEGDYAIPGYLVDNGKLFYQNGKGTEIEIHAYH